MRQLHLSCDPEAVRRWCTDVAGSDVLYVAPSAAARRRAIDAFLDRSHGAVGATIVQPARLLGILEAQAWLEPLATVSPALARGLAIAAAREAGLPLFDAAPPAGAVAAVLSLIEALRTNRVTPAAFEAAGGDPVATRTFARYEERRSALGLADETDRIDRLRTHLGRVRIGTLVLEDPVLRSAAHAELLRDVVARSERCRVGLPLLDAAGPAAQAIEFFRTLGFAVEEDAAGAPPAAAPMRVVAAAGLDGEVELVAREVAALLARPDEPPVAPSEVLCVAPTGQYRERLHAALGRLGIPVASPRRVPVLDLPLVHALLETLVALADERDDTSERGRELLALPYLGLAQATRDSLDRWCVRRGLGAIRTWALAPSRNPKRVVARLGADAAALAAELAGERPPAAYARVLSQLAFDYHYLASGRRLHLADGREEAVRLDQQGWDALLAAVESLDDALAATGVRTLSFAAWLGELRELLAGESVRLDAHGLDGVHVTVAGAGLPPAPHVFAVGWCEGVFPRRVREAPLLPAEVARTLNAADGHCRLPLPDAEVERDRERRERILRAAGRALTISYAASTPDGSPALPSFYLADLGLAAAETRTVADTTWPLPLAASRGERLARATFLARHRPAATLGAERGAVEQMLDALTPDEARVVRGERHAPQRIALPADIAHEIAEQSRQMSASQARQLARCLYWHFGEKRLGLAALEEPGVGRPELGTIGHRVLAALGPDGFAPDRFDAAFEAAWAAAVPAALRERAEVQFERARLVVRLRAFVEAEHGLVAQMHAVPAHFELAFGLGDADGERRDPASRPDGWRLALPADAAIGATVLRGAIDRVDTWRDGGTTWAVAIDYKDGKGASNWDETQTGLDFQLAIYCGMLRELGYAPAGALFVGLASGERHGFLRADVAARFVPEPPKTVTLLPAAEFDGRLEQWTAQLGQLVARASRAELVVEPRDGDCKWCELRPVCRIGTFAVAGKERHDD